MERWKVPYERSMKMEVLFFAPLGSLELLLPANGEEVLVEAQIKILLGDTREQAHPLTRPWR
jgi:hypothetical protein